MFVDELHFNVDGTEQPVASMLFHAQDEPFPGGHIFVLRLKNQTLSALIPSRINAPSHGSAGRVSAHIFGLVQSEVAFLKGYGRKSRWILNTVDRVTSEAGVLILEGRCSPVNE